MTTTTTPAETEAAAYSALLIGAAALTEARAQLEAAERAYDLARDAWAVAYEALP